MRAHPYWKYRREETLLHAASTNSTSTAESPPIFLEDFVVTSFRFRHRTDGRGGRGKGEAEPRATHCRRDERTVMLAPMSPDLSIADDSPKPHESEAGLLAALRAGDDAAFEHLVRRYGPQLMVVVRRYLPEEHDAQDALQDTFLSAFNALDRFQGDASLATWLHRIAVNAALMKLRTRRRRPEKPIDDLLPKFIDDGHRAEPRDEWTATPDQLLADREMRDLVRRAIDQLPDGYRTILLLRDIDERTTEETAELLGLSVANVKTRLHRARQALRELLDRRLGEASR